MSLSGRKGRLIRMRIFLIPAPGPVRNLEVRPVPDSYRKLIVTWDAPTILEQHGRIISFSLHLVVGQICNILKSSAKKQMIT
jgi:hypothetical protein